MGSEAPSQLPLIDFSNLELKAGSPEWDSVKTLVRKALEEYGCFEAIFSRIPLDIGKGIFGALKDLFDLPLETKLRNVNTKGPFRGYIGQYPMVPLYESLGIEDPNMFQNVEILTNTLWPQGNPSFSKIIHSFSLHLSEMEQIVRRMVFESLGVEKYLEEQMESSNYLLRVMKYKGPETSEKELGLNSHTDLNMVSILYQNEVEGLEVQTQDGEWINLKPSPDKFFVFIGDAFHAWTNGRLRRAPHRVMMAGTESRYSAAVFSLPKTGCIVKAPTELVNDDHPLLFKPFIYDDYVKFVYGKYGNDIDDFPLKAFSGV